jgi:hypothetical protein
MNKNLNIELIKKLNVEASKNKKSTFKYDKYIVRSEYGIEQKPCCGMGCMFCLYDNKKESTIPIKITEYSQCHEFF